MEEIISLLVPIYNSGKYLEKCIESVIKQTYKNLEIILIDDGSTDDSGEICDKYASIDKRIKVIHKKNEGVSVARNIGIEKATGEYIGFVDSDDFIHPQMYEILYRMIKEYQLDMAVCKTKDIEVREISFPTYDVQDEVLKAEVVDKEQVLNNFSNVYYDKIWLTFMQKLYSRKALKNIRFKRGTICEDEISFHHTIDNCKNIGITELELYYYFLSPNSLTRESFSKSRFDILDALYDRYLFFTEKKIQSEIDYWGNKYIGKIIELWHLVNRKEKRYKKMYIDNYLVILPKKKELFQYCNINIQIRIHIFLLSKFPNLEYKLYTFVEKRRSK